MFTKNEEKAKIYIQILDLFCIIISFYISMWILFGKLNINLRQTAYGYMLILLLLCCVTIFNLSNTYSGFLKRGFFDEFLHIFRLNLVVALFTGAILFYFEVTPIYSSIFFASFFLSNTLVIYIARQYFKVILLAYYEKSGISKKVMVISTSDRINSVISNTKKVKEWEFQITSIAIIDKNMVGVKISGVPVVASKENFLEVATKSIVDVVFISIPNSEHVKIDDIILDFENTGIDVYLSISNFDFNISAKTISSFYGYNVLTFASKVFNRGFLLLKRVLDVIGGLAGLALTLFIGIFIAPAIKIESPGPVIFSQIRIGKNGRKFNIYKFRSMYIDAEARKKELMEHNEMQGLMFKIENDPRVTKVGSFIRKTSIDEMPQFLNVIKGDMSLVGTRPPTEDEFLQYESRHKRRLTMRPGITGLWQVSGRSTVKNFEEVVKLDLEYIDNWSLLMDFKLIVKTLVVVFLRAVSKQ